MRVLFWSGTFPPYIGGAETLASHLLPALARRGHQLLIVTSHGNLSLPDEDSYMGIPVRRFPFWEALSRCDLELVARLRHKVLRLKSQFAPNLVHLNSVGISSFFHVTTARARAAPVLLTLNQYLPPGAAGRETLQGELVRSAAWVACCSEALLKHLCRTVPEVTAVSSVVHNALPLPPARPAPLPRRPSVLLCLGRLIREKGFDLALQAAKRLRTRFPELRLVIAGDGPARPQLERLAGEMGITRAVDFTGWVPPAQVYGLINGATVVLVPSRWEEAFGLVALEAALMGRPVVASRMGGLPEVVVHEQTGLLVDRESPAALAEAVASLLADPDRAARYGAAGRRRAARDFALEGAVRTYDALYRRLAAAPAPAGSTNR